MPRLCVRGISNQAGAEDLRALFSKIGTVKEVYVPGPTITGLRRDFGIVNIEGDDEAAKKCAKSLNGSLWKGSKLCVEIAHEWYRDRLHREREELEAIAQSTLHEDQPSDSIVPPPISKSSIRLRKIKYQEVPQLISMAPGVQIPGNAVKRQRLAPHTVPCGTRIIFDEELLSSPHFPNLEGMEEDFSGVKASQVEKQTEELRERAREKRSDSITSAPPAPSSEMAAIVQKLSTGEVKAIGGGVRKGFGTLSVPTVTTTKPVQDGHIDQKGERVGGKQVDCCVEEQEQFVPAHLLDEEDDSADDEPCVSLAEVEAEVLEKERLRALNVLDALLSATENGTADSASGAKKTKKELRKEAQEKKRVAFAEAANTEHQIVEEGVVTTETKEALETQAILDELKGLRKAAPAQIAAPPVSAAKPSAIASRAPGERQAGVSFESTSSQVQEPEVLSTKDGYANMNQLKDIFYREGGVWWGDDGKLSGAVTKGAVAADPLFLEAEKRGIDIRALTKNTAGSGANNGAIFNFMGESSGPEAPAGDVGDKGMMFGFFSAPDTAAAEAAVAATTPAPAVVAAQKQGQPSVVPRITEVVSSDKRADEPPERPVLVDMTAEEMVALARKFTREKAVDVLNSEWRDGKDRLVLDYKRKRRDMKRRTAAWSSSNPTASATGADRTTPRRGPSSGTGSGGSSAGTGRGGPSHYLRGRNRGGAARKKARKS